MIVSREYIPFRTLISQHDKAADLFIKLSKKSYPADMWAQCFLDLSDYALYQRQMEWAFRGIKELIDGFRKLDEEDPYDTGYELEDAASAEVLRVDGNEMKLLLRTSEEQGSEIVGVITVNAQSTN